MQNPILKMIIVGMPKNGLFQFKSHQIELPDGRIGITKQSGILFLDQRTFDKKQLEESKIDLYKQFRISTANKYAHEIYGPIIPLLVQLRNDVIFTAQDQRKRDEMTDRFNDIIKFCTGD